MSNSSDALRKVSVSRLQVEIVDFDGKCGNVEKTGLSDTPSVASTLDWASPLGQLKENTGNVHAESTPCVERFRFGWICWLFGFV